MSDILTPTDHFDEAVDFATAIWGVARERDDYPSRSDYLAGDAAQQEIVTEALTQRFGLSPTMARLAHEVGWIAFDAELIKREKRLAEIEEKIRKVFAERRTSDD